MADNIEHQDKGKPVANCDQLQNDEVVVTTPVESRIMSIRGNQIMIDRDLAELYGVETKRLNEAVKRNIERFPEHFRFQLTKKEMAELVANCDRFNSLKHSTVRSYAFTEQGVAMLSTVLRSETAIRVSIRIMDAFVAMRRFMVTNAEVFQRLSTMEYHQLEMQQHQQETDKRIDEVFRRLDEGNAKPKQGVFYNGQIYDAYTFVSDLIKSAKKRIILIDNYVDETVLTLLDKKGNDVSAVIYTQQISRQFQLDIDRHNAQYAPIDVETFRLSHDRFLCIDDDVYHIGASIKDLGKKWFGFSKMDVDDKGFCCNDSSLEAAQTRALARAAKNNFQEGDSYEKMQFYYHPDHLGSSSYITNLDGEVVQHIEYVPFGEVFVEERNNIWNTPYLFNAKEFDEETGLYYYGARYYDPRHNNKRPVR